MNREMNSEVQNESNMKMVGENSDLRKVKYVTMESVKTFSGRNG